MLTHLFPFLDPAHITPGLARRLRALADDCERLELGRSVSPVLLQKAPLLEDWAPAVRPEGLRLIGYATSHPLLGERAVVTSPVWFADPDGTWVRTLSRFYRLGSPIDPNGVRRILASSGTSKVIPGDGDGSEDKA
jgi:hypothetical protein